MKKTANLLKCLKSYHQLLDNLSISKKDYQELGILINSLEKMENVEFKKIIQSLENTQQDVKCSKQKVNINYITNLYKEIDSGNLLSEEDLEILHKFEMTNNIKEFLTMDLERLKDIIYKNADEIKSIDGLKLILNYRFNIDIKGRKSRKSIISEAVYLINQNQYYKNIEKAYKNID